MRTTNANLEYLRKGNPAMCGGCTRGSWQDSRSLAPCVHRHEPNMLLPAPAAYYCGVAFTYLVLVVRILWPVVPASHLEHTVADGEMLLRQPFEMRMVSKTTINIPVPSRCGNPCGSPILLLSPSVAGNFSSSSTVVLLSWRDLTG